MKTQYRLTIKPDEQYIVHIVEVCKPRFKGDTETHRVQLHNGNILRVYPSQLKMIK